MAGQIINRGTNKWLVRVFLGRDEYGKKKYHNKTINGTKKDAQKYLNAVLREKDIGVYFQSSKDSVNKYLDQWLESSAKPRLRERTYNSYVELLKRYIRPYLGASLLGKLTPLDIQSTYSALGEKGLSPATIRRSHAVLRSALSQAVKWQLIMRNPVEFVDLPKEEKKEMLAMTTDETKKFLEKAKEDKFYILFLLLVTTGIRPGEALTLKWKDLNNSKIHIQRSLYRNKNGFQFTEPKTPKSRRTIPIPFTVNNELLKLKAEKEELFNSNNNAYNDLIFTNEKGGPLELRNIVKRHFKPVLKKSNINEKIRLYDLRHTCATILLEAGENPKIVSERLGHASIRLTIDTYTHVLPDMQQKATEKLETILFS